MDTRFWGPDGWKLFHSIAVGYPTTPRLIDKQLYATFFKTLPYVLPCIYCRRSFAQYLGELPIEPYLENKETLSRWLYLMHNKVNAKLRGQGLGVGEDPSFEEIYARYRGYVRDINRSQCVGMPGWNFLYCVLFVFPEHKRDIEVGRYYQLISFFYLLKRVVPFHMFQERLKLYLTKYPVSQYMKGRTMLKKWGYELEQDVSKQIHCTCIDFEKRCDLIESHRAGCTGSRADTKPTCRVMRLKKKL